MIRRRFLGLAALAGVGGMVTVEGMDIAEQKTVTFRIAGFTCITCAVGLEVMLRRQKGVKSAQASYPDATVTIQFHPELVSDPRLHELFLRHQLSPTPRHL